MTSKAKVNKMSEEDEEKVAMWIRESKGRSSLLQDEKMAERYPVAYSSFGNGQQESSTKEQSKEDETMTSIDSSAMTPPSIVTEHAPIEPARQDCRKETTGEESVVETGPESSDPVPSSETPEASIMPTEAISLTDWNVDKQPPIHRVSSRQRRLSFEEYRSIYLPVPKIENCMPGSSVPDSATNWIR